MLGMSDFIVISASTEGSLCALSSSSHFDGKRGA
jgi:hypothetical protein